MTSRPMNDAERAIAFLLERKHRGHENPVQIAEIRRALPNLSEREVKAAIENLRMLYRKPVGSKRDQPAGYFWIVSAEDQEAAARSYRQQILSMFRVLQVIDSPERMREFAGQLTLLEDSHG